MKKIMVVDDEKEILEIIGIFLEQAGYEVSLYEDVIEALNTFDDSYLLVISDISMPHMDGIDFCREVRKLSNVPILFLTARIQETDIVKGLSVGADDYLIKPFKKTELVARADALVRRYELYKGKSECDSTIVIGTMHINENQNTVFIDNKEMNIREKEFQILHLLASHQGRVYSISEIYEAVWNEPYLRASANTVMVHIRLLRKKIEENPEKPEIIKNVWGRGYQIERR